LQILEIIGDSFFCSTQGANLSVPGANMVFWSPTTGLSNENGIETVATPTEPTNYVANYFDGNGCEGLTEPFEVIPGAFPVAAFTWEQISNYEVVFSNFSENADEVVWLIENVTYTTGGNENVTHDFPNEGSYPISMIVQNDCGDDTLSMTIEVLKQTSTFDLQTYKSLTFYPNPANDYVTIMFDENNHGDRLIIRDLSGRVIENVRITELNQKIDVTKFNAGIYFADVINNGTLYRGRFVISHTN
jgi:PKD repeat protein